ncbi:YbjN domain-containing protein [Clostridium sp. SHJSY1]|uniref:YbjN domain-containing protein n=1 Tax=Clostridium sp. SHJSY1 TaxID=2942483 RepID=UPI0028752D7B|nr:YbjN domain-containing protein [Clostridium sp. SHJSY1]MDS0526081.1 YbjN domain-containing protein [Clostridium sp. SHJSY1]
MSNANLFKQFLDGKEIYAEVRENGEEAYFEFQQKLKSGSSGRVVVNISGDTLVSIYALDYVSLANTARRDYMYKLFNELNYRYTYYKFFLDNDNNIFLSAYIPIENNFSPTLVMNLLIGLIDVMEKEYANIMKTMWA